MLDWAKISETVEHALTLEGSDLNDYLKTISNTQEEAHIKRLIKQSQKNTGFLATSASEDIVDETLFEKGTLIGSWEILSHIGRGGMGDVYKAKRADGLYEQIAALKVIKSVSASRAKMFEIERKRLALMNHPGIARIIDGGKFEDSHPYMVMEYVDGLCITDYCDKHKLSQTQRLSLFMSVCSAVEHAHGQLVLHKDIKSQNVLVDSHANTHLIDFGISSEVDEQASVNSAFSLATAAPEQLKGEAVSVQTDVFSLGVLLHELLTSARPTRLQNGAMQADEHAISDADLLAIINKSLSVNPEARYSTCTSLYNDINAFLTNMPVEARRATWAYKAGKFLKRYPLASAFAAIALVSLVAGLTMSLNFANDARIEAKRANTALEEAEQNLARANFFLNRADLFHATQSAYADTLQSLFGAEADVDKQTKVLKERWQQAHELRADDPDNAAYLSYAIGRHFLFRNDYKTAIDILEPWVNEEYGPNDLVGFARQLLAIAYFSVGREQEALPLLRKTEAWFASSFEAGTPDHIAAATQVASLTESNEDILRAEALLLEGLKEEQFVQITMYFWNQLSKLRQLRGDFQGAYEAIKETVNLVNDRPLMERTGSDTGILNLANFELWHTQDLDKVKNLATNVIDNGLESKGESREIGIAYQVLAEHSVLSKDYNEALNYITKSYTLIEKYSGASSNTALRNRIVFAEIQSLLANEKAFDTIEVVKQELMSSDKSSRLLSRVKLAEIFITKQLKGIPAANELYKQLQSDISNIDKNIELHYVHERLKQEGLKIAD